MTIETLQFLLAAAEDILFNIKQCPHCQSCSTLASSYFEAARVEVPDYIEQYNTCLSSKTSGY